jgi:hypothetical protein
MKPTHLTRPLTIAAITALLSTAAGAQQGRAHAEAWVATLLKNTPSTLVTSTRSSRFGIEAIGEEAGQVQSQQNWVYKGMPTGSAQAQIGLKTGSGRVQASYQVSHHGIGFGTTGAWYFGPTVSHEAEARIPKRGGTDVGAQARADSDNIFTYEIGGPTAETLEMLVYGVARLSVRRTNSPSVQMFAKVYFDVSHDDPDSPPFVAAGPTSFKLRKGIGVNSLIHFGQKGQQTLSLSKDAGQTIRITVKVRVEAWILDGNPLGLILAQGPKALSPTPTGARPGRAWMRRRDTRLA